MVLVIPIWAFWLRTAIGNNFSFFLVWAARTTLPEFLIAWARAMSSWGVLGSKKEISKPIILALLIFEINWAWTLLFQGHWPMVCIDLSSMATMTISELTGREVKRRSDDLNCQVSKKPKRKRMESKMETPMPIAKFGRILRNTNLLYLIKLS